MNVKQPLLILALGAALVLPGAALAQPSGGGDRPAPGGSGGNVGGPGMSGAALNAGTPQMGQGGGGGMQMQGGGGNMPNGQGGNLPNGQGSNLPDISGGGGGNPPGRPGGGDRPQGGGNLSGRPGGEGRPGGGGGNLPELPLGQEGQPGALLRGEGGLLAQLQAGGRAGGGFAPFSGEGGGLLARFGERGAGNLQLPFMQDGAGGFGAFSQGAPFSGIANLEGAPWHPAEGTLPAAPAALDDFTSVADAQQQAQTAIQNAANQPSEQASRAADQATQAAQDAYNQLWSDYYDAVDYTADAYYDTVTASTDYMLETYQDAVDYTTDAVDYYIDYAEQYNSYCALYPWDCYSYAYDVTASTYVYVGDTSSDVVSTTQIGDVTTMTSVPVQSLPSPSADAYEAIVVFANDQLGAVVEPLYAGAATENVQQMMAYMPAEMQAYLLNASSISGAAYWGLLHGGVAAVMVGDCTTGNCAISQENLSVQLSSASAGGYGILANAAVPTSTQEALALITQVYPKLKGLAFAQITDVELGLAFTATTASVGFDTTTQQPVSVAKVVYAGVVNVNGTPYVYAIVGVGQGYVGLLS